MGSLAPQVAGALYVLVPLRASGGRRARVLGTLSVHLPPGRPAPSDGEALLRPVA